jgi:hypothetical protein
MVSDCSGAGNQSELADRGFPTIPFFGFCIAYRVFYGSTFLSAPLRLGRIGKGHLHCRLCDEAVRPANNERSPNFIDTPRLNVDHVDYSIS